MKRSNYDCSPVSVQAGTSAHDILRLLYKHGSKRQSEIARMLNVSPAACTRQFKILCGEDWIEESSAAYEGMGRPSSPWRIRRENWFLGIYFLDGVLSAELIDFSEQPVWTKRIPIGTPDRRTFFLRVRDLTMEAETVATRKSGTIRQCHLGIPGIFGPDGRVVNSLGAAALNGNDPEKEFAEFSSIPCFSDSLYLCSALGNSDGIAPESTALVLTWESGLGCVVVSDRKLLTWPLVRPNRPRGIWNFGHIRVSDEPRHCPCGKDGCLEAYVGGRALREAHPELLCASDEELVAQILAGAPEAVRTIRNAAEFLAKQLYWLVELFGVDVIVFTGIFAEAFPCYKDAFRSGLRQWRTPEEVAMIGLSARPGEQHSRHGAALTAKQFYFYPEDPLALRGLGRLELRKSEPEGELQKNVPVFV